MKNNMVLYFLIRNMKVFHLLSDKTYLKFVFKLRTGQRLDLKNPRTFNEKLQWLKLYNRIDMYTTMVDKYEVKNYVSNIIGEEYIIPTLGVFNRFNDIDFNILPNQFVIKCTHDSGGLVIVKNKEELIIKEAEKKINKSFKKNYYYFGREWPYKNIKPRIIIEEFIEDEEYPAIRDYKFYCFNGEPKYLYVSEGLEDHSTAQIEFFDMNFEPAPFGRSDYRRFKIKPQKPYNFEKMKELAKVLSQDIPFVRVDFYEVNKKIYFGELTFTPCSGYMPFDPEEWDKKLGDMLELPKEKIVEKNEK